MKGGGGGVGKGDEIRGAREGAGSLASAEALAAGASTGPQAQGSQPQAGEHL